MYIHIIARTFPHYQLRAFTLLNMCIHIIKYVHSFYYTHISVCHFVGVFIYAGTINRSPTAADGLPFRCKRISITLRTPTKWGANTPPGVGADSSRPYPNIIKYTYSRHQIRVSVSPHTYIHIINYVFLHNQIRIFTSSNTHIHFTEYAFPFPISWVYTYTRAR